MSERTGSPARVARVAGFLYLIVVIGGFSSLYLSSPLIVPGDPSATAAKILASEFRYRAGFAIDLIANAAYLAVVALLYGLFKPVDARLSAIAAAFGVVGCAVGGANALDGLDPILIAAMGKENFSLLTLTLRSNVIGGNVVLAFFGFYCLSLGFLAVDAKFLPRILGALLALAGVAWLTRSFLTFLAPSITREVSTYLLTVAGVGEIAFTLWLLVAGVNNAKWRAQAESA
jgi:Domain of unknown function (DUF4386)